jgi:hypothetical protein
MTFNISKKLRTQIAKNFKDSFTILEPKKVGYVYIGKTTPNTEILTDTVENDKKVWDRMIAAKKIASGDVEFVLPKQNWTANSYYKQFDDTQTIDFLMSPSTINGNTYLPMYVMNSSGDVYKCLCNDTGNKSTVEPTGNYSENDGFIQTEDNLLWKYMYNIRATNKFLTNTWMPVPYTFVKTTSISDYDVSANNVVAGGLNKIVVTSQGSGYFHTTLNVTTFASGANSLTITDLIDLPTSNIKINMEVSGTGILSGTYITGLSNSLNRITLSENTIGNGGGTASNNRISIRTRILVQGDGTQTTSNVRLSTDGNGRIEKITVENAGINYTRANVVIFGSGTGANARVVLPPKFGHGYNPAEEFSSNNIMVVETIGEIDSSENNLVPVDITYREYGIVLDPNKYNQETPLSYSNANTIVSQTTDVTLLPGLPYTQNEMVYQGPVSNPFMSATVVSQSDSVVKLNNVRGNVIVGSILIGGSSGIQRPVVAVKTPDLELYTGNILYKANVTSGITRYDGQAEQIKLVIQF